MGRSEVQYVDSHGLSMAFPSAVVMPPFVDRAPRACEKCTRTKKKCDKSMPHCSRCSRLAIACCYSFTYAPPTVTTDFSFSSPMRPLPHLRYRDDDASAGARPAHVRMPSASAPATATAMAAAAAASAAGLSPPVLTSPVGLTGPDGDISARQILSLLSAPGLSWAEVADWFFATVHGWMGVVHQDWFRARISTAADSVDLALLLVCMHLAVLEPTGQRPATRPPADMLAVPLYRTAKKLLVLVRAFAPPSIELVQAAALVAQYECGHGDCGRAYVTLGDAISMARVLGLRSPRYADAADPDGSPAAIEREQQCLLYWSLYILDKTIHFDPNHLATPVHMSLPPADALLPSLNRVWDSSAGRHVCTRVTISLAAALNLDDNPPLGAFQRSIQAAVLIHRALLWLEGMRTTPWCSSAVSASASGSASSLSSSPSPPASAASAASFCSASFGTSSNPSAPLTMSVPMPMPIQMPMQMHTTHMHHPAAVGAFTALEVQTRRLIELIVVQADVFDEFCESLAMCFALLLLLHATVLTTAQTQPQARSTLPASLDVDALKARAGLNLAVRMVADSATALNNRLAAYPDQASLVSPASAFASFLALRALSELDCVVDDGDALFHNIYLSMFFVAQRWAVAARLASCVDPLAESRHNSPSPNHSPNRNLPLLSPAR